MHSTTISELICANREVIALMLQKPDEELLSFANSVIQKHGLTVEPEA